ncbi:hypothetical protein [Methylibium sp.]|uniref:hypothetical protein n=1 Tax=Methylibium sp. TaxID=2067992 RepID=UPI0017DA1526|nr:hypothetical protein [Methylibium sp.]MBA3588313.1 hypothetical protein [Methylibium sp.]
MSIEQAFIALIGCACAVSGWFARELYQAVNTLQKQLYELEVRIGTDYVRYDRLQDVMAPVLKKLDEIQTVLTQKVDK